MAIKKQLAEQVLRKLSGGNLKPDRQIDIREVMLDMDQLRDEYVKVSFYNNLKEGGYVIDQEFLSEYKVYKYNDTITLPVKPIALPRNMGIYAIYRGVDGEHFIILDSASRNAYRGNSELMSTLKTYISFVGNVGYMTGGISGSYFSYDWFLPSRDELNYMYVNLYSEGVGNFANTSYWSSSEIGATGAYSQYFSGSGPQDSSAKSNSTRLRPARSFVGLTGAYSLRDVGPAGGLIFHAPESTYRDGYSTYYEAYPSDLSNTSWSNITNVEIGTTNTSVGSGFANTNAIISQEGHTASAAQNCLDYAEFTSLIVASSKDIAEDEEYPLTPDAESAILDALFNKYAPHKQIPHDEREDGQK